MEEAALAGFSNHLSSHHPFPSLPIPSAFQQYSWGFVVPHGACAFQGDRVQWVNDQNVGIQHTVTSGSPGTVGAGVLFDSPLLNYSNSFIHTFSATGVYPYFCRLHTFMQTSIEVRSKPSGGGGGGIREAKES